LRAFWQLLGYGASAVAPSPYDGCPRSSAVKIGWTAPTGRQDDADTALAFGEGAAPHYTPLGRPPLASSS